MTMNVRIFFFQYCSSPPPPPPPPPPRARAAKIKMEIRRTGASPLPLIRSWGDSNCAGAITLAPASNHTEIFVVDNSNFKVELITYNF